MGFNVEYKSSVVKIGILWGIGELMALLNPSHQLGSLTSF